MTAATASTSVPRPWRTLRPSARRRGFQLRAQGVQALASTPRLQAEARGAAARPSEGKRSRPCL
eukprot:5697590-Lingulodinium_polyedra.AAC.1